MEPRESEGPSDEELVRAYLADPQGAAGGRAVDALVRRWSSRVYRWAHRVVRDHERALDLAQDSLLLMLEGLPRYEPRGRFSAWLFVIVHHRCLSAVRRRSLDVDPEIDTDSLGAAQAGPDDELETAEERQRIFDAMEGLEPRERAALWMRAYEGMSVEAITEALHLEGSTGARGLLQTARRKLRAALSDGGERGRT